MVFSFKIAHSCLHEREDVITADIVNYWLQKVITQNSLLCYFSSSDPSELTLPDRKKRGRPPKKRKHEDPQLRCDKASLFCCQCQLPVTEKCLHVHVLSTCTVFVKDNSESFCHCRRHNCSPHDLWTFFIYV